MCIYGWHWVIRPSFLGQIIWVKICKKEKERKG
jgi:hypothetical protein